MRVLNALCALGIRTPGTVDHELVLVGTRRKVQSGGIDAVAFFIGHRLGGRIPVVEAARKVHLATDIGTNAEGDALRLGL